MPPCHGTGWFFAPPRKSIHMLGSPKKDPLNPLESPKWHWLFLSPIGANAYDSHHIERNSILQKINVPNQNNPITFMDLLLTWVWSKKFFCRSQTYFLDIVPISCATNQWTDSYIIIVLFVPQCYVCMYIIRYD